VTRTWGGEIWLSSSNVLVDNGLASAGEYGVFGPEGTWLVEGHGVDPDLVVDNLPHATFRGEDAQLKAAVDSLLATLAKEAVAPVVVPKTPDKSLRK
jgi:tricorn protease